MLLFFLYSLLVVAVAIKCPGEQKYRSSVCPCCSASKDAHGSCALPAPLLFPSDASGLWRTRFHGAGSMSVPAPPDP